VGLESDYKLNMFTPEERLSNIRLQSSFIIRKTELTPPNQVLKYIKPEQILFIPCFLTFTVLRIWIL